MLGISDLKPGVTLIMEHQPYEVLEAKHIMLGRGRGHLETRIKNLITGSVLRRNFRQNDQFGEADVSYSDITFLYRHREQYFFSDPKDPKSRFTLTAEQLGETANYLKPNMTVQAFHFENKFVNISLPIKVDLQVTEAPPGIKGDTAQGGTKIVTLETGAHINVPLFINAGDVVRINTKTGEYVERMEKTRE